MFWLLDILLFCRRRLKAEKENSDGEFINILFLNNSLLTQFHTIDLDFHCNFVW